MGSSPSFPIVSLPRERIAIVTGGNTGKSMEYLCVHVEGLSQHAVSYSVGLPYRPASETFRWWADGSPLPDVCWVGLLIIRVAIVMCSCKHRKIFFAYAVKIYYYIPKFKNEQCVQNRWELRGRVLDSRPRGRGFEPHLRCFLEQDTPILA